MRQDIRARLRSEKSFARKPGKLKPRALYLIVCEDTKSSPRYFEDLRTRFRLTTVEVEVHGSVYGSDPMNVVKFAHDRRVQRRQAGSPPDQTFCVVDVDHHTTLDPAKSFASAHKIDLIISRPCFERWYLLHFEHGDRPFTCYDQIEGPLKKHLPRYDKGTFTEFDTLWLRSRTALANAARLRQSRATDPLQTAYTDVDLVLIAMLEAAGSPPLPTLADEQRSAPKSRSRGGSKPR